MEEKEYLYWLCHIPPLGAVSILKLQERFGSFREVYRAGEQTIRRSGCLNEKQADALLQKKQELDICTKEYHSLAEQKIRFVSILEEEYPKRLRPFHNRPVGLFVKGRLPDENLLSVAVVGARNCTEYGRQLAELFARELSKNGIQIISGLASGIDGAAHRGALSGETATFGVLGCGVNYCYPRENFSLYQKMAETGGILTEFVPGAKPMPMNFPMRNRIISGLSDLVLIIEAKEKSGSLITVDWALEQGKEVYAIPGRITDENSAGCNRLIRNGAGIALGPEDIFDVLGIKYVKKLTLHKKTEKRLAKKENLVYSCLDLRPKHLEEIMGQCRLSVAECMECLLELELLGLAIGTGNQYYCRKL